MAGNPDFEWNDWSEFLNEDAENAFADQANGLKHAGSCWIVSFFFIRQLMVPFSRLSGTQRFSEGSSLDDSWYQPIDPFSDPPLDHPYFGRPYTGHEVFSTTLVPSNDTLRSFSPAPTGLPADIVPGSTASLGDAGLPNPLQGIDQVNLGLENAQYNGFDDMVEAPFFGGAHVDTKATPITSSALRSVSVGKPDEADDKITVADIDRLFGIHDRVCTCLNCLD